MGATWTSGAQEEGATWSTPDHSIDTSVLEWALDSSNVKATGIGTIEITGTDNDEKKTWTVGSKTASGCQVFLIINNRCHAMVLLKGCFYTSKQQDTIYPYVLMDRIGGIQNYRLIKDITKYKSYKCWQKIDCGNSMATAEALVRVTQADLGRRWARDLNNPTDQESFCLHYALSMLQALEVLKNVQPVEAEIWTKDQMEKAIKHVDPCWTRPGQTDVLYCEVCVLM